MNTTRTTTLTRGQSINLTTGKITETLATGTEIPETAIRQGWPYHVTEGLAANDPLALAWVFGDRY